MFILVANLGSTSFKYRLFRAVDGQLSPITKGGYERVTDYGATIEEALHQLVADGFVASKDDIAAVGFKTVLGENLSGCVAADDACLKALDAAALVAPAHNPPYAAGIRQFQQLLPAAHLVALFETAFYQWMPLANRHYAVPPSWFEAGVQRNGFHGASHKFIAERSAVLMGRADVAEQVRYLYHRPRVELSGAPLRVISCHLGGSSSITAMVNGVAIGNSMGFSPQSGLPHNNRVGELDSMAVPYVMKRLGLAPDEVERQLNKESGLLGLSGVSNDLRDIKEAADAGNPRAQLALDHFIFHLRHWIGAFWLQMGGCDALVFTAGIGENNPWLREAVCAGWESLGVQLDTAWNAACRDEARISTTDSPTQVWVIPTNEEHVVASEALRFVEIKNG